MLRHYLLFAMLLVLAGPVHAQKKLEKAAEYYQLANQEVDKGDYQKSIPHFLKAVKADPTGACGTSVKGKAQGDLGYAYFRAGDSTSAMTYYNKAIKLNAKNPYPRINKAALFLMQKKQQQALKELDAVIAQHPELIDGYVQRGFIHHSEKQYEHARHDLEKALALNQQQEILPDPLIHTIQKKLEEMK